ncbi:MAG: hypothetical protein HKP45_07730 [Winogradskyella sp.]|nr:hypothetical protein [Winogradskyella sp.]
MKKFSILGLFIFALISLNSCKTEDDVVFVTDNNGELAFTNSFSAEYVLTPQTSGNLGERFTWEDASVDVPTNITYQLHKSITGDFTDAETVGATTGNEIAITIGDMLGYAAEAGLDSDPETEAPNTGEVSFRLRSFIGDGGEENFSSTASLTVVLPEATDVTAVCEFDELYGVGHALSQTRWTWDNSPKFVCSGNGVYKANVHLTAYSGNDDGNFRFFTVPTDWASGRNYPWYADAGYTIDANLVNAQDGDSNFRFVGTTGEYLLTIDDVNKTITLGEPEAIGTCEFDALYTVGAAITQTGWTWDNPADYFCDANGVYQTYVQLTAYTGNDDGNFRFFTVPTDWDSGRNYPWYADAGYTIDVNLVNAMDGDSNFRFIGTDGFYVLAIDDVNKTITLTAAP